MYLKTLIFLRLSFLFVVALGVSSCNKEEDPTAQLSAEVNAIDEFLEVVSSEPTIYDQSGMRMVIHQLGNDHPPRTGQTVRFEYTLSLFSTGAVIESGVMNDLLENMPTEGLRYALNSMMGKSIATFYVPSKYAYGEAGTTLIPGNSILIYEITSPIEVIKTTAQQTQFTTDTTAIRQYINANTSTIKNPIKLSSGIWYTIDAVGTGRFPTPYDNITFQYKLTIMSNGSVVQEGSLPSLGSTISPFGLIDGLKVGMSYAQEGGTATFYIPSGLAYGVAGQTGIPTNANLIFRIQLNSVSPYFP